MNMLFHRGLAVAVTFLLGSKAFAQCPVGELEVVIEVITDAYGYETYWELLPGGSACGNGTIFSGGNPLVGCGGAGAQQQQPGGYGNNLTITEGPFCLTQGATFDIFWADDWGDAGLSFSVLVQGVNIANFVGTGDGETFSFVAELPVARDMSVTGLTTALYAFRDEPVRVIGTVASLGTDPVTSFDLNYRINGGAPVVQSVGSVNLQAGDVLEFEHATPWVPTSSGTFTLEVWASNINGGSDMAPANDLATSSTLVNEPIPNILDQYLVGLPVVEAIADSDQDLLVPRDLDFHPDLSRNELWVINKDTEQSGGSTVKFTNVGQPGMTWLMQEDPNNWHFMSLPTGIAFADNDNFATSPGIFDANQNGGDPFTGPSLWSSDPAIYAQGIFGPLGSHLDMLHVNPNSQGIAHEQWNRFWVVDGYNGDIVMNDFREDHGPGNNYHGDAIIRRYSDFTITRDPNEHVVSHCVLDKTSGWLYVVDHGGQRVLRMDIRSGAVSGPATFGPWENYVEYSTVSGYTWEVIVSSGLVQPAGIDVVGDRMVVSDHASGELIIYDISSPPAVELGRVPTGAPGLMGVKLGPDGRIWAVNATAHALLRVSPENMVGTTDRAAAGLRLAPVPAEEVLYITGLGDAGRSVPVEVLDASGRVVLVARLDGGTDELDLTPLRSGAYVIRGNGRVARFSRK
ncbi:MAG TPA: hypothetical protein PKE21_11255 [Flavobacteriales bacterium]|nr:hypothetical protein [Flavobacteriales bacterium]HMR28047.1 hypothetical protein [Flavobacteriales bacterium]